VNAAPAAAHISAPILRLSTDELAPRERVEAWREIIGRGLRKLEVEPHTDGEFRAELTQRSLPGVSIVTGKITVSDNGRFRQRFDSDDLFLSIARSGKSRFAAHGREVLPGVGDAVLVGGCNGAIKDAYAESEFISLRVPREAIGSGVTNLNDSICRRIPAGSPALRLLTRYLGVLDDTAILTSPRVQQHVVTHVHELMALTVGATRDTADAAEGRGLAAARLREIKDDIARNLEHGDLSIGAIAMRHRMTPRYVQKLFEREGTTFSECVLQQRLAHAHRALSDPLRAGEKIATIAFAAGFGDISYFYRAFRRRYDVLPSDLRATALRPS
jgi:AraC-like DNA-binding protein